MKGKSKGQVLAIICGKAKGKGKAGAVPENAREDASGPDEPRPRKISPKKPKKGTAEPGQMSTKRTLEYLDNDAGLESAKKVRKTEKDGVSPKKRRGKGQAKDKAKGKGGSKKKDAEAEDDGAEEPEEEHEEVSPKAKAAQAKNKAGKAKGRSKNKDAEAEDEGAEEQEEEQEEVSPKTKAAQAKNKAKGKAKGRSKNKDAEAEDEGAEEQEEEQEEVSPKTKTAQAKAKAKGRSKKKDAEAEDDGAEEQEEEQEEVSPKTKTAQAKAKGKGGSKKKDAEAEDDGAEEPEEEHEEVSPKTKAAQAKNKAKGKAKGRSKKKDAEAEDEGAEEQEEEQEEQEDDAVYPEDPQERRSLKGATKADRGELVQSRLDDLKHVIKTPRPLPRPKLVETPVQGKSQQTLLDTWAAEENPIETKSKGINQGNNWITEYEANNGKNTSLQGLVFLDCLYVLCIFPCQGEIMFWPHQNFQNFRGIERASQHAGKAAKKGTHPNLGNMCLLGRCFLHLCWIYFGSNLHFQKVT